MIRMWPALLVVFASLVTTHCSAPPTFDMVITGGRIVDGTGASWFHGDVAIAGDRIGAIGDIGSATARTRIDATGLVVAPGFIDMLGQSEFNVLVDNRAASTITQGVTTEVTGEGTSIAPVNDRMIRDGSASYTHFNVVHDWHSLAEYFARLDYGTHPTINVATFVGAGGLRDYVIGKNDRPATAGELVELARVAAARGGIYISHQRSESGRIVESLDEVFAIAERARIPAEIYHLKTAYKANWGKMPDVLARIDAARARGLDVTANLYPYDRASNNLDACLPLWVREGGVEKMLARLKDPVDPERAKRDMDDRTSTTWENQWYGSGGGDGVLLTSVLNPELRQYEGMPLTEIGHALGKDPRDALMDVVIADRGESGCIISIMTEDDVRTALKYPQAVGRGHERGLQPRVHGHARHLGGHAPCRSRGRLAPHRRQGRAGAHQWPAVSRGGVGVGQPYDCGDRCRPCREGGRRGDALRLAGRLAARRCVGGVHRLGLRPDHALEPPVAPSRSGMKCVMTRSSILMFLLTRGPGSLSLDHLVEKRFLSTDQ
ncbi:MAG: hypothetical protein AABY89_04830 [Acidobacteriota bacterium]